MFDRLLSIYDRLYSFALIRKKQTLIGEKYFVFCISENEQLVIEIDQHVTKSLSNNGTPTDLLLSLATRLHEIRDLMDSLPQHELDLYCEKYNGFCIFMLFLEELFAEISSGRIHIPTYH